MTYIGASLYIRYSTVYPLLDWRHENSGQKQKPMDKDNLKIKYCGIKPWIHEYNVINQWEKHLIAVKYYISFCW